MWQTEYFDSAEDTMKFGTHAKDMAMTVEKIPILSVRADNDQDGRGDVRRKYPDYSDWWWNDAKANWDNPKDNFTVPTGMFQNQVKSNLI